MFLESSSIRVGFATDRQGPAAQDFAMTDAVEPDPARSDPRMRGFRTRTAVAEVLASIDSRVGPLGDELVAGWELAGRVLAQDVAATANVPAFDRAAMDGYAIRGAETHGADAYSPIEFRCVGTARPGRAWTRTVEPGEVVEIATGAPMPAGTDTVVPVEMTARSGATVRVTEAVPPGRHVGRAGEDVVAGTTVLKAGRGLRPQDVGLLSGLGLAGARVVRRPVVSILATGDELRPPFESPSGHQFADMNTPMLEALVRRDGGLPRFDAPLADDRPSLLRAIATAAESDLVLISGGSSTGPEDHAPGIVAELGELSIHGVAVRPASPAGLGRVGTTPVVLLPGNPVSCLCAYDLFAGRVLRRLGGRPAEWPYRSVARPLGRKLVSAIGRSDYVRVALTPDGQVEPLGIGGASILSSTCRADGFVLVPPDLEGYPAGAAVTVWLYDG